jgi:short-subunit dehydrogenase
MGNIQTLVVGGSSGLGLALAKEFASKGGKVIVTGRSRPEAIALEFQELDLSKNPSAEIKNLVKNLSKVDRLVYAAGLYNFGRITDLTDEQIEAMTNVSGLSLMYFMRNILEKQEGLAELITITSTSQWIPRKNEPVYNFVKAGLGQFSNSMAEDGRVGRVLVAAPSAMKPEFSDEVNQGKLDKMLDKTWVAQQIVAALDSGYKYRCIKLLSNPARVEEIEKR